MARFSDYGDRIDREPVERENHTTDPRQFQAEPGFRIFSEHAEIYVSKLFPKRVANCETELHEIKFRLKDSGARR